MDYSERLKELRIKNNIKQKDIADFLNISRSTYKDYELKIAIIPTKHLINICDYFNVSIDYILGLNIKENYPNTNQNINLKEIGLRIKIFRKEQKLTQSDLSRLINSVQSVIVRIEAGTNLIATPFLYTICKKYNISADYLLGRIDTPKYLTKEN